MSNTVNGTPAHSMLRVMGAVLPTIGGLALFLNVLLLMTFNSFGTDVEGVVARIGEIVLSATIAGVCMGVGGVAWLVLLGLAALDEQAAVRTEKGPSTHVG